MTNIFMAGLVLWTVLAGRPCLAARPVTDLESIAYSLKELLQQAGPH